MGGFAYVVFGMAYLLGFSIFESGQLKVSEKVILLVVLSAAMLFFASFA